MNYAAEKLYQAVDTLASGSSHLRIRIEYAWHFLCRLQDQDVEPEFWKELSDLQAEIIRVEPVGNEGSFAATLATMSDEELSKHASRIVGLFLDAAPYFYAKPKPKSEHLEAN